jgi:hypothetical protein
MHHYVLKVLWTTFKVVSLDKSLTGGNNQALNAGIIYQKQYSSGP